MSSSSPSMKSLFGRSSKSPTLLSGNAGGEGMAIAQPTAAATASGDDSALVSNQRIIMGILAVVLIFSLVGQEGINYFFDVFMRNTVEALSYIAASLGYSTGTIINTTANVAANTAVTGIEVADGAVTSLGDVFRKANESKTNPELRRELDEMLDSSEKPFLPRGLGTWEGGPPPPTSTSASSSVGSGGNTASKEDVAALRAEVDRLIAAAEAKQNGGGASGPHAATGAPKGDDAATSRIQKPVTATQAAFCYIGEFEGKRGCVQVESGQVCQSGQLYQSREACKLK